MRVRVIKKIDSPINEVEYNVGQVINVVEMDDISKKCYGRYYKFDGEYVVDWIPKDSVKLASDEDEELQWKSKINEWGEIYCPFLGRHLNTYYPVSSKPYDTITNPFIDDDGNIYYYKYDHDEGGWKDEIFYFCDAGEYENIEEILFY